MKNSIDSSFGVTFEWFTKTIPSNNTVTMEIVWTPKVEVKTKDTITIIDDRHFKKDVALIFKSIDSNSNSNASSKSTKPSVVTKTARNVTGKLKIKSPSPPQDLLRHAMLTNKQKFKSTAKHPVPATVSKAPLHVAGQMPLSEINIFNQQTKLNPVHGKENKSPPRSPLSVTAMFDEIQFTPDNRRNKRNLADIDDIDYMASLPTPVLKPVHPTHNSTYALGNPSDTMEITSFEPNIASTIGKGTTALEPIQFSDSDPRRKLFDMTTGSLCHDNNMTSTVPVFNVTHTIVPASFGLTEIKEEQADELNTMQNTFKLMSQLKEDLSSNENFTAQRNSQHGIDTLHKKFQSMRHLDDFSFEQKILRDNLGSMPNLTDILAVKSIECNRYFYQSIENGLQANDKRNQSSVNSVFGGSVESFNEHDILAQSSRFNLNKSHGLDAPLINENQPEFAFPQPVDNYRNKRHCDDHYGKQNKAPKWSPPKRTKLDSSSNSSICSSSNKSVRRTTTNWAGVKPKKFPHIPKLNLTRHKPEEERVVFFDPEHHFKGELSSSSFFHFSVNFSF